MTSDDRTVIGVKARVPKGTRLNGIYEIDHLIAKGGMGEVYKGHAIETGDSVAIKMIRTDLAESADALGLFRKEAAALHNLHHEAIVRYFVFTIDPVLGNPYLAMDFVDGQSLGERIKEGPLSNDELDILRKRIAGGFQAAHELGIIHRDVSPDNIILPSGNISRAKIIDFGIARSTAAGSATIIGSGFAGKYKYASPEQLGMQGGDVNARSDIYSFGLVLAEAATGSALDMSGTQVEIIAKRQRVPDLTAVNARLRPLIESMLQPRPEDRPASMAEVAAWQPAAPVAAKKKSSAPLLIGAAAVVLVLGGAGYAFMSGAFIGKPSTATTASRSKEAPTLQEQPAQQVAAAAPTASSSPAQAVPSASAPVPLPPFSQTVDPPAPPASSQQATQPAVQAALPPVAAPPAITQPRPSAPVAAATPPLAVPPVQSAPPPARPPSPAVNPPTVAPNPAPTPNNQAIAAVSPPVIPTPSPPTAAPAAISPPAAIPQPPMNAAQRYVADYDGGSCFFLQPIEISDRKALVEGFGSSTAPFVAFNDDFIAKNGFEADISVRQVSDAQCALVGFLSGLKNRFDRNLKLQINSFSIRSGETLSGSIDGLGGRNLALLLVADDGYVYDLTSYLKREADPPTFGLKVQIAGKAGSRPTIVIAVASAKPLPGMPGTRPVTADALFSRLATEAKQSNEPLGIALKYFRLEG